jgi:tRNA threonylcarbamoyladenosine biosynthesis protein TsaB
MTQSVAVHDGERTLALLGARGGRGASDRVLTLAERALELAGLRLGELDAVAVSRGPGSLTGLRVGIGTARGLAIGTGKGLLGVSTLQALAAGVGIGPPVLALLDAGRGEVYGGLFEAGDPPVRIGKEQIGPPAEFAKAVADRRIRLVGSGAERYRDLFPGASWLTSTGEEFLAAGVARVAFALAGRVSAAGTIPPAAASGELDASPRYLRREDVSISFGPREG